MTGFECPFKDRGCRYMDSQGNCTYEDAEVPGECPLELQIEEDPELLGG